MASELDNEESFQVIKSRLLQSGKLFEDTVFPAKEASIGKIHPSIRGELDHKNIEWKRPKEILRASGINLKPLFIRDEATRADFDQGKVGDCWFIAAAACLAVTNKKLLNQIILPDGHAQSFSADYAGIFRFRFWRYGKWEEVIIDDRLPTVGGKLVFAHNIEQPNEFWAALMEKAYAKLHGSYFGLHNGYTEDAMVDLTGGISKWYKLNGPTRDPRAAPKNLYDIMQNVVKSNCLMSCSISAPRLEWEAHTKKGLYKGHAYSITDLTEIQTTSGQSVKLIRLRNPWGKGEWYGDWSERPRRQGKHIISSLWDNVDDGTKKRLNFKKSDDGEFWMSYDDWLQHFEYHQMCFLSADEMINPGALDSGKAGWKTTRYEGKWEPGVNAGGRPINNPPDYGGNYWKNPQYKVQLDSGSPLELGDCTMLVSLMEVDSRKKDKDIAIGVRVHREIQPQVAEEWRKVVADSGHHHDREVTAHFTGRPGDYIVVPSTFEPNQKASFLLRIFTEY